MTARLDISHREDHKGLELIATNLTDPNGNTASVADIVAGNLAAGTAAALTLSSTLDVQGATTLEGAVDMDSTLQVDGQATFSLMPIWPVHTLAAAGTGVVGDAAQLVSGITTVTAADGTTAVKLPATPVAGTVCIVKNTVSNHVLPVFPDASATVNAVGSHGAISMAASTIAIFVATSTTQWYTIPLLPS